ncbi:MAG: hypothetical protein AABW46_03755 [Nanoarchaeota archaeon]
MRKWVLLLIIALLIVNTFFLLKYVISKTDKCAVSCQDKGFSSGMCLSVSASQRPCEARGLVTDNTYRLYCEDTGVCCCER